MKKLNKQQGEILIEAFTALDLYYRVPEHIRGLGTHLINIIMILIESLMGPQVRNHKQVMTHIIMNVIENNSIKDITEHIKERYISLDD